MLLRSKKIPTLIYIHKNFVFYIKKPELLISFEKGIKIQAFLFDMICLTIKGADSAKKSAVSLA